MKRKQIKPVFFCLFFMLVAVSAGCANRQEVQRVQDKMTLHILFEYNKFVISDKSRAEMNDAIDFVKKYPGSRIEIAGHTDNRGTQKYNQTLSEKRAEAVREYLIKEGGVDPAKITAVGHRDLYPIAPNRKPDGKDNPEGRAQNRRVEINILSD